jgi:transposase
LVIDPEGDFVLAAIDIHKAVFQAAVLDPASGEIAEERFKASREALVAWIERCSGALDVVAIEATTGWRWVARELRAHGIEVRLTDPGQASALQGNRKRAKTDRLDARWLVLLLARELLPDAWLPPEDIQRLRDQTRLRKALTDDHTRWAQRLHALLVHEGWPCSRGSLLTDKGRRWVAGIRLHPTARAQIDTMLAVMATLSHEIDLIDCGLGRQAKIDPRLRELQQIYGIGPTSRAPSWPRSATRPGSAARARSSAPPALTPSSGSRPTSAVADTSPSRERPICAGRSSRPPNTRAARPAPTTSSTAATTATPAQTRPPSPSRARSASAPSTSCAPSRPPAPEHGRRARGRRPPNRMTVGRGELLLRPGRSPRSPR